MSDSPDPKTWAQMKAEMTARKAAKREAEDKAAREKASQARAVIPPPPDLKPCARLLFMQRSRDGWRIRWFSDLPTNEYLLEQLRRMSQYMPRLAYEGVDGSWWIAESKIDAISWCFANFHKKRPNAS